MNIQVNTDGVGKSMEIRRQEGETDKDEVKAIRSLIRFLIDQLSQRAGLDPFE